MDTWQDAEELISEWNVIEWSRAGPMDRLAIVELCGWCNRKGKATPHGRKMAQTEWNQLSPAARHVMKRAGVVE